MKSKSFLKSIIRFRKYKFIQFHLHLHFNLANACKTTFSWRADDGPTLNAGLTALWFFRGPGPILLRNPIFCDFSGEGSGPTAPLFICPCLSLAYIFLISRNHGFKTNTKRAILPFRQTWAISRNHGFKTNTKRAILPVRQTWAFTQCTNALSRINSGWL